VEAGWGQCVEAEQMHCKSNEDLLNLLAAVIHKNHREAAGNSENVLHT